MTQEIEVLTPAGPRTERIYSRDISRDGACGGRPTLSDRTACAKPVDWRACPGRRCTGSCKTTAVKTLADTIHASFKRIQFTPDLLPADLIGTQIYQPRTEEFVIKRDLYLPT